MSNDITGQGLVVNLIASKTLPLGVTITQWADDADPFDVPSIKIADTAMGLNGDLLVWSKAVATTIDLNVIPGSDDDVTLSVLAAANRIGKGKSSAGDVITMTGIYPDGSTIICSRGRLTDAMPGKSVSGSGRLKTKLYRFMFENIAGN